ncbi:hypothetical protein QTP88_011897 [Uroleucon formosanum]
METEHSSKLRYPKVLLRSVAHLSEQLNKYHRTLSTTPSTNKDNAYILEEILSWENKVNFYDVFHQYIRSMWELPEIGNFLAILFKKLDLDIINQGEIERMFLMPKESTTMGKVMTTLLMPVKKTKCIGQVMPYKVWSKKLSKKVSDWCKVYHTKNQNKVIAMNLLGIHPDFWTVVNEKNPLIEKDYCELSYFIKVWLVKGLCDYVTIKFKTINDIVTNCNARQSTIWKNDLETEEYFFFDTMPDLRIYYYNIPYDEPCLEFLESVKTNNKVVQFKDNLTINGFCEGLHTIQQRKHFKLIADSVESLRAFIYELDMKGTSVPESLISSLNNFIVNIEPKEYNYIVINNDSKIKLFKDWVSYSDRIKKDEDNISVWEEKDSKSISKTKNEELIIAEKRQRKLIVWQNFDTHESDEYISENDKFSSGFTDSEDEWGAMNQPKLKVKQPQQTPSKLFLELEKRVSEAGKMLKYDANQSDVKQVKQLRNEDKFSKHSTHKMCKINEKDKSIKSYILPKIQNEVKIRSNDTNILPLVNDNFKVKTSQQTPIKHIKLEKQLREENTILKHRSIKAFNEKDKYIKSVKLPKIQNEVKIRSNNTNILPLINDNFKVKRSQQTPIKRIKLEKQLKEESTISKHRSIKVFDKKDKCIKSINSLKTQNKVKYINNPNTFVYGHNQRLVHSNVDIDCNYEKVILIDNNKEKSQKSPGDLRRVEIINLDEDNMQNDCEIFNDNFELSLSTCTKNKSGKSNKQNNYKQIESAVISIEDDQIVISDDEDAVQFVSMTEKPKCSPSKTNKLCSLKTNLNKSNNSVSINRPIIPTNCIKHTAKSSIIHQLSPNITIMPANVNIPKGIKVTLVKTPQLRIDSNFNSIKRKSAMLNGHPPDNPSTINVKCELISKSNLNGEVKFFVRLPNGKEHPGPNELINQYLKLHNNQLPDYWLVPLPVEVAKQYGFN